MRKLAAVLTLTLALAGTVTAASAQTDPVSRVSWASGTGTVLCLGLGTPLQPTHAGEGVVLAKCSAARQDQSWDFTGDMLKPYGTPFAVTVTATGRLILTTGTGAVWTYGPGHTLRAPGPSGQLEYLAYTGTGRYPVLGGPGSRIWYVFTKIG